MLIRFFNVYRVSSSVQYGSLITLVPPTMIWLANSMPWFILALLVLGMYKEVVERIGLRRVLVLNLVCAALAVSYSIASCQYNGSQLLLPHSIIMMLTRYHDTVWFHHAWTTEAALLSFVFDVLGGGDVVRITMACKCIADIMPPENLHVLSTALSMEPTS